MSGASMFIGSFALRAPQKDEKPTAQKRKAAFAAVAPKKQPPKISFSTANTAKRPENDTDNPKAEAVVQKKDGKLQLWLGAGNGDRPGCEEARDYLMRGTPYKGTHASGCKDVVKDAGARWMPNPLKLDKNVPHWRDGISNGWFVAHTEHDLIELINLPYVPRVANSRFNEHRQPLEVPQWTPIDVPAKSRDIVVLLIREFEAFRKDENEREQKTLAKERDAKEEAKRSAQQHNNVPADVKADIDNIKTKWGIHWTDDMSLAAMRCPALGPHSGISSIRRVLRGLHLKCCTVDEVISGAYESDAAAARKARLKLKQPSDAEGDVVDDAPLEYTDYTKVPIVGPSSGCYMIGTGPGMLTPATDSEWEAIRERSARYDRRCIKASKQGADGLEAQASPFASLETWCIACTAQVIQQFNDCSCAHEEHWQWCVECHGAWHSKLQPCRCGAPEKWDQQQETTRAEAARRLEKADRDLVFSHSAGHDNDEDREKEITWHTREDDRDDNPDSFGEGGTLHSMWYDR